MRSERRAYQAQWAARKRAAMTPDERAAANAAAVIRTRDWRSKHRTPAQEARRAYLARLADMTPTERKAHDKRLATERQRRYRHGNPEVSRRATATWRITHPEHARDIAHRRRTNACEHAACTVRGVIRLSWGRYPHECHICGTSLTFEQAHFDHVVPVARGGLHCVDNVMPACPPCNTQKGAR